MRPYLLILFAFVLASGCAFAASAGLHAATERAFAQVRP